MANVCTAIILLKECGINKRQAFGGLHLKFGLFRLAKRSTSLKTSHDSMLHVDKPDRLLPDHVMLTLVPTFR